MPKVSEAHVQSRRRQILKAAHKCLGRKGFSQTTMRDIGQEAGLSLGGIYAHFASKEELIQTLAEMGRQQTRAFMDATPHGDPAPKAAAALLHSLVANLEIAECVESVRTDVGLWGESLHTPELKRLVVEAFQNAMGPFVEVVRRGQKRGEVRPDVSAEAAGRVFLSVFMGLAVQKAVDPKADTRACTEVIASLLDGSFDLRRRPA